MIACPPAGQKDPHLGFDHRLYCKVPSEREKVKQELFSRAWREEERGEQGGEEESESVTTFSEASSVSDVEEEEGVEIAREEVVEMEVESIAKVVEEIEETDEDKWEGRWVEGYGWEDHDWEWEELKEMKVKEERRDRHREGEQVVNVLMSDKNTNQEREEKGEVQKNAERSKIKEDMEKEKSVHISKMIDPFLDNFLYVMSVKKTKVEHAVLSEKRKKQYLDTEACNTDVKENNIEEDEESVISNISDKDIFCDIQQENTVFEHNNMFTNEYDTEEEVIENDLGEDILADLTPCDIRVLVHSEDQLSQCRTFERIFPTPKTGRYLKVRAELVKVELKPYYY